MPIPKDYRDILNNLAAMSDDGRVKWKSAPFGVEVAVKESKFVLWAGTDEETDRPFVSCSLQNHAGKTLDSWFVDAGDADFDFMNRLHGAAKRQAMGITKILAELRDVIESSSVVGEQKEPKEGK